MHAGPVDLPRTLALVNLAAIERNAARLAARLRAGAALCAVVKADGYGHGAAPVARAALAGGARRLAVVTAAEAAALRAAGVDAELIVLGSLRGAEVGQALDAGAEPVVWMDEEVDRLLDARRPAAVHVKLDSGMGRLGEADAERALALCARVAAAPQLRLAGVMTHFATADTPADPSFAEQLERFRAFAARAQAAHPGVIAHAANSAAALAEPASHFDMARAGVALYGLDPFQRDPADHGLEPALSWTSRLVAVKRALPGDAVGYGRRFVADAPTWVGTVSAGYADGVRRALGAAAPPAEVLVGGRRAPLAGAVSMDSFAVDLGPDAPERPGDVVTLVGEAGGERATAEQMAAALGTINYEVTCAISPRVPRAYHRDGEPVA